MNVQIYADGFDGGTKRARPLDKCELIASEVGIMFADPLDMLECLTRERVRVCEAARTHPMSISGLAEALGRDRKSVTQDVSKLAELGIIRLRDRVNPGHGKARIVEPVARKFELRSSL